MGWRLHRFEMDHLMTPVARQIIGKARRGAFAIKTS